jgi:DNA-binding transcriptional regulator LsrR (DeoR family)
VVHLTSKSVQRLQWRRDKVREYSIKGYNQRDIAAELQIPLMNVNRDLKYLRQQAKANIQHYIDEDLPLKYQNCLNTLDMIVKEMWSIDPEDNRELMQSRTLIKECCAMQIELLSNATVIDRAVKFVDRHRGLIPQNNEITVDDTVS